jgi:hypothetical protein
VSGVKVVTFGCRLNTYESETMRKAGETAGLNNALCFNTCAVTGDAVRQARQTIRKARRETRTPASSSRAAPRRPSLKHSRHGRSRCGDRQRRQGLRPPPTALPDSASPEREDPRQRHHGSARNRTADDRGHRGPCPRLRAGAERLRSPLHLLYHSLWPRQFPFGADGRGGRPDRTCGRKRLSGGRHHRCRCHQLWRRSAGQTDAWHVWPEPFSNRCPISSGCGCPRSIPSRPTTT